MTKSFLIVNKQGKDDVDFFLILHSACDQQGNFQWFLKDGSNDNKEQYIEDQVYESITISSKWIKENAENKCIGCHCLLKDEEYTEMLGMLSSDILTIIRNNSLFSIDICDDNGNIKNSYVIKD